MLDHRLQRSSNLRRPLFCMLLLYKLLGGQIVYRPSEEYIILFNYHVYLRGKDIAQSVHIKMPSSGLLVCHSKE